jgi:hypothetical protein
VVDLTTGGYATTADLANWLNDNPPANGLQLLRSASLRVARACMRDPYIDTPTDVEAPVLRDATTAQAAAWMALGVDPNAAGLDTKVVTESKIGTADVKYDTIPAADVQQAVVELAPEAAEILTAAGLISLDMPVWTGTDYLPSYGLDRHWPYDYDGLSPLAERPLAWWP